ncbi:MAG: patatin-like phospholipase family protein [Pseudomonadales bacterium]|nr:patatin-like phospholipase family protein [Pseudomonadales bacterium]
MTEDTYMATVSVLREYFDLPQREADDIASQLKTIHLAGGQVLFKQGDPADSMYLLVRGRLQVWLDSEAPVYIGEVVPGESVGEVGLITGEARSADVVAVRSCILVKFEQTAFERLAAEHPSMVMRLTAIVAKRLHENTIGADSKKRPSPSIICLRPLDNTEKLVQLSESICAELEKHGSVLYLTPEILQRYEERSFPASESDRISQEFEHWCGQQEQAHRFLVLGCTAKHNKWSEFAEGQSDLILLLGASESEPSLREFEKQSSVVPRHVKHKVLLLSHPDEQITDTCRWLENRETEYHLHIRGGSDADLQRVGRMLSGNANGLVLGGGAARGFAHIGTYRALCEAGIPVDWIGGTSIGAIMGVAIALYGDVDLVEEKVRAAFVKGKPFEDYTLPVVSVLSGNRMNKLSQRFMPGEIEDLAIPFFAISSDINTGDVNIHESGQIWRATSASAALPGVLPPVVHRNNLAVDGAVLNNLPVDVMATKPVGQIFAVKLSSQNDSEVEFDDVPSGWKLLMAKILPGEALDIPSLTSLLFKATEVANRKRTTQLADRADILFEPPVQNFSLLKVNQFDEVVNAGYEHGIRILSETFDVES